MRIRPTLPATLPAALPAVVAALCAVGLAASHLARAEGVAADSASVVADSGSTTVAPPDAAKGKVTYEKHCVNCHKQEGTGGVKSIPDGNASRNFRDLGFWKNRTDAQLASAIEVGFPKSGMMAWKKVLAQADIRNVIAYMRARFQPKRTPTAPVAKAK